MADVPADSGDDQDTLRDDIARAFTEVTGNDVPAKTDDAPASDDAPTPSDQDKDKAAADQRARDQAGRFAKADAKPRQTLTLKKPNGADTAQRGDAAASVQAQGDEPAKDGQPVPQGERIPPPVHWKGNEKIKWERLPRDVQAAFKADYERFGNEARTSAPVMAALEKSRELLLREGGGTMEGGVGKLLALSEWASTKPVEFVQTFIRQRGLSPAQVFGQGDAAPFNGQAAPQTQNSPDVAALRQRLDAFENAQKRQSQSATLAHIETFANDPAHPFFADVADDIEKLLRSDPTMGLDGAYDRAVWMNPTTRAQLIQQQNGGGASQENQQAVAAARRAKAAAISGSPVPGNKSKPAGEQADDLRAELTRNYNAAVGNGRV